MNRTVFLVDGFNLYHSVKDAQFNLGGSGTKWLDLHRFCQSYLQIIGSDSQLTSVYYFSALAEHLETTKADVTKRHRLYLDCLRDTGVIVELARFKKKMVWCNKCKRRHTQYEEKETDVAIAVKLIELFVSNECDTAVIITGDTDISPAIRALKRMFPEANVCFAFPYGRRNRELSHLVKLSIQITKEAYKSHQLPDPFVCTDGRKITKPVDW